jgi:hypothetical protein
VGELTQIVSFDLVDEVLAETGRTQLRLRLLPSRVIVYFVLALALFPEVGYRGVWDKLVAGLTELDLTVPSTAGLRAARERVGVAPLRALFELLAGPQAGPRTPGTWWRELRPVAIDGTSIAIPDSDTNRAWAGKQHNGKAIAGYPWIRLVTLIECGTRAMIAAVFGTPADGELTYATKLTAHLRAGMLLLADRNFDAGTFLADIAATGADLLVRLKANRRPPLLHRHHDGSIASIIAGIPVRVIEALITVTGADGTRRTEHYRLVTTLLDPHHYPAHEIINLYHERWEIETTYLAVKHTILHGRILRSHHRSGIEQEIWALLTIYQTLRITMLNATDTVPDTDPDRAAFTTALHTARDQLTTATHVLAEETIDLIGKIGQQTLNNLLPPRRQRINPRTVKRPLSPYAYTKNRNPTTTITIHTTITNTATSPLTRQPPP